MAGILHPVGARGARRHLRDTVRGMDASARASSLPSSLHERRVACGMTLATLAARAGVSVASVAAWERGARTPQAASWQRVDATLRAHERASLELAAAFGGLTDIDTQAPAGEWEAGGAGAEGVSRAQRSRDADGSKSRATGHARAQRRMRPYTKTEDRRIRSAVAAGRDLEALAHSLGRPGGSVRRRAAQLGALVRAQRSRTPLTPDERAAIVGGYRDGKGRAQIAGEIGRSVHTVNAVLRRAGVETRRDVSPVSHRPDGTRQCRACRHWLPATSFGSGQRGTCRRCRLGSRAEPRIVLNPATARSGPRVRARDLTGVIDGLIRECGSAAIAAERVGLGEDALIGIRRRGEHGVETTSLATADRILVAAGLTLDLLPDDAIITP